MKATFILFIFFATQLALAQKIIFITHQANSVEKLTPFQISEIFLKKTRTWPDGTSIRFFDRENDSVERKSFLTLVMKRSSRDLDQYWIGQKLYTGNSAPTQMSSDTMTLSLVARFPGSISYILEDKFQGKLGIKTIEVSPNP